MVVCGPNCLTGAFIPPWARCSTKGQPTRLLGNESTEIGLQTNATYHADLQVYRVNSTLQLHRVDQPLLLRCTVQNFLGTNSQDITLVPHGECCGRCLSQRWGARLSPLCLQPEGARSQDSPLIAAVLDGRKLGYSAQNKASYRQSRRGCPRRSLEPLHPLATDILFPPLAGSSLQGSKMRVPEQVPSVLLLARGSLDGATD